MTKTKSENSQLLTLSRSLTRSGCFDGMCFLRKSGPLNSLLHALHRNLPSASCLMCGEVMRVISSSAFLPPNSAGSSVARLNSSDSLVSRSFSKMPAATGRGKEGTWSVIQDVEAI